MVSEESAGELEVQHSARLDLFKTLGDNTRYAIYLELARSAKALTTAEIADMIELHPTRCGRISNECVTLASSQWPSTGVATSVGRNTGTRSPQTHLRWASNRP